MSSRASEKAAAREARLADERAAESAAARKRRLLIFGGILAAAAAIVLIAVLVSQSETDEKPTIAERANVFAGIPQDGAWLGDPTAPVVVEEYVDMQCPFCAQFATEELPDIVRDYVRTGKVRMRLQVLSFLGPDSVTAGRATAAAAQQGGMWQFAEAFFANQGQENSGYVTEQFIRRTAEEADLDAEQILAARDSAGVREMLAEATRSAKENEVNGTPTFRVGKADGQLVNTTPDGLRDEIGKALEGAEVP